MKILLGLIIFWGATQSYASTPTPCQITNVFQTQTNWPKVGSYRIFTDEQYYYEILNGHTIRLLDINTNQLIKITTLESLPNDGYYSGNRLHKGELYFSIPDNNVIVPVDPMTGKADYSRNISVAPDMLYFQMFDDRIIYWSFNKIYSQSLHKNSEPKILYNSNFEFNTNYLGENDLVFSPTGYEADRPWRYIDLQTGLLSNEVTFSADLVAYAKKGDWIYLGNRTHHALWNIKTDETQIFPINEEINAAAIDGKLLYQFTDNHHVRISMANDPQNILCSSPLPLPLKHKFDLFFLSEFMSGGYIWGYNDSWNLFNSFRVTLPQY